MKMPGSSLHVQFASCILFVGIPTSQTLSSNSVFVDETSATQGSAIYRDVRPEGTSHRIGALPRSFLQESNRGQGSQAILEDRIREWNDREASPVSEVAASKARDFLAHLTNSPERVGITEDSSVLFTYASEGKSILVEFFETGELAAVVSNPESDELFDSESVKEVAAFVSASLEFA
jgi:hypothetical protein